MKNIWVDIDDIMNNFIDYIIDELNKYTWKSIFLKEIDFWHLHEIWWITFEELKNIYKKSNIYNKVPLLQENIDIIKSLEKKWYNVIFITSRFLFNDYNTMKITKDIFLNNWMKNDIYIWMNKEKICKKLNINIFIDDALYNCLKVKNYNKSTKVFLLNKIWNWEKEVQRLKNEWFNLENLDEIKRIDTLKEILLFI